MSILQISHFSKSCARMFQQRGLADATPLLAVRIAVFGAVLSCTFASVAVPTILYVRLRPAWVSYEVYAGGGWQRWCSC